MADVSICSVEDCSNPVRVKSKRFCLAHYKRDLKYGSPTGGPRGMRAADGVPMQWLKDHVNYQGEECLKWPFADRGNGYGAATDEKGRLTGAHNLMCRMAHGDHDGVRKLAAHSCGKGHELCVNPKHLRWATVAENSADMRGHGTLRFGVNHYMAKLSEKDVKEIIAARGKIRQVDLAKQYGVKQAHISRIQIGGVWDHLRNAD